MNAAPASTQPSPRPGLTLAVLTGLNGLNYLDRFVSAPILPFIITGLHLSDGLGGSLQSAFIFTFALACPIAGWFGDRWPRLRIAAAGIKRTAQRTNRPGVDRAMCHIVDLKGVFTDAAFLLERTRCVPAVGRPRQIEPAPGRHRDNRRQDKSGPQGEE